jgi:anti-sigma factor RsiW
MDRDTIERLAIDLAGGELESDVEALLEAYLADHPEWRETAARMRAAYQHCREAVEARVRTALPASATRGPVTARRPRPRRGRWLGRAAALLLALAVGAAGGWWAGRDRGPTAVRVVRVREAAAESDTARTERFGPFWQAKIQALMEGRSGPPPSEVDGHKRFWSRFLPPEKETS